jgi:hypothetical protein
MSVFKVNLQSGKVEHRIKTGYLVGVERDDIKTVGRRQPRLRRRRLARDLCVERDERSHLDRQS